MESGGSIIDIHYFCATDVTVGLRHKLQEWAKHAYNIPLEIHDGQAISEDLTDHDIFWIAEQFLNIPAELYPTPPSDNAETWYNELLKSWKTTEQSLNSYADFSEIKKALRHATFTESAKKDLPFWIQRMETVVSMTPYELLKRKAVYEIAVASLRGLGSMVGYEGRLSTYFEQVPALTTPSELEDATILWIYCTGAYHQNAVQIALDDLRKWHSSIVEKIELELETATQPGARCVLLQTSGLLYLQTGAEQDDMSMIDIAIDSWLKLASLVENAYLFPLEAFADQLTQLLQFPIFNSCLVTHPGFLKLTQQIDELLAKRHGGFVAAAKCRDRAMALYEQGKMLLAIKEIHRAKIQWFAKETLRGSLLATLFVSSCYEQLGLVFAAKYYAMVAAYIAIHNPDGVQSMISNALNMAAACDYSTGAYCGFLELTDVSLAAFNIFSKDVDPLDPQGEICKTLFHASILHALAGHLSADLLGFVDNRIKSWAGLKEYLDDLVPAAENAWKKQDLSEIWASLENQMHDRPFSDTGKTRHVQFLALGVTWRFMWDNTYELTSLGEEIVAVMQVILADIADTDWYLLRTTIEVELVFGPDNELQQMPSNELGRWRLTLANNPTNDDPNIIALNLATTLLKHASLLPSKQYLNKIENAFQEGLSHKIFFGQRYSTLYQEFITKERFESSNRASFTTPDSDRPFKATAHNQISWYGSPGPGYSKEAAEQALKNRYENSIRPIQRTLQWLTKQPAFIDAVHLLRTQGWLDWHILNATSLIVLNYRVNKEISFHTDREKWQKYFWELMDQPEDENAAPVPMSEFSAENLRLHLWTSMQSTLKNLGFELHQTTPDFGAISVFLGERYRYWKDDIDHPNYGF